MATFPRDPATMNRRALGFGVAAVCMGFGGLAFLFLAPLGALLSAVGLICGIIGWLQAPARRQIGFSWSLWGTFLSFRALSANVWILHYGTIKFWLFGG
jgi:hypothetical protein